MGSLARNQLPGSHLSSFRYDPSRAKSASYLPQPQRKAQHPALIKIIVGREKLLGFNAKG